MLDIGWSEMLIVGVVALVVVGPKDLPKMFHAVGEFTGKARGMAREFQRAMETAAKEAGVDGIAKDLRKVTSGRALKDAVGFDEIEKDFRSIGRDMTDVRKSPKAKTMPKAATGAEVDAETAKPAGMVSVEDMFDEAGADEAEAQDHDSDLAARNAEMSAVEEQRLIRARKIATARQQAAEIRARREAEEAEHAAPEQTAQQWRPGARQAPAKSAPDAPETVAETDTGTTPTAARARPDAES